jgi:hypothetical protein
MGKNSARPWPRAETRRVFVGSVTFPCVPSGFARWAGSIRDGLRAIHARGELNGDPDDLAQRDLHRASGGLLTTRIRRDSTPLAVALDTMIDHIEPLAASR